MQDITIRQGETLELDITADDDSAETVQFIAADEDGDPVINITASFTTTEGVTSAVITTNDTDLPVGEYDYMLVITYSDNTIKKLPEAGSCEDDDCSLPILKICESLSVPEVS